MFFFGFFLALYFSFRPFIHSRHYGVLVFGEFERRGQQFKRLLGEQFLLLFRVKEIVYRHRLICKQADEPYNLVKRVLEVFCLCEFVAEILKAPVSARYCLCGGGGQYKFVFASAEVYVCTCPIILLITVILLKFFRMLSEKIVLFPVSANSQSKKTNYSVPLTQAKKIRKPLICKDLRIFYISG